MSKYIPTEWFNGDTITAEKLNKIENSIKDVSSAINTPSDLKNEIYFYTNGSSPDEYGGWYSFDQAVKTFLPNAANEEFTDFNILGINRQTENLKWYAPEDISLLPSTDCGDLDNATLILIRDRETNGLKWIKIDELGRMLDGCGE